MNTAPGASTDDGRLPELTDDRVDELEKSLFTAISRERATRRRRRTGVWLAAGAAAVVIVAAVAIAPSVSMLVSPSATDEAGSAPVAPAGGDGGGNDADLGVTEEAGRDAGAAAADSATGEREVITTASATVVVDDVGDAAREVAEAAEAHDGYVESMSVGQYGQPMPVDQMGEVVYDTYPAPDGAWVTIRVPSDQLAAVIDELSDLGEVTASAINRQDVTEQTLDLRARTEAAQASVDRLIDLMSQAASLTDLLAAESALAERQATLESYQQQLEYLEGQVAMSSLTVNLVPVSEPVEADPAGFTDGLVAGWNGLVATLNGIVIALGFLIPWIAVALLVGLIVWGIVRVVRRRRARPVAGVDWKDEPEDPPAV